jgi:small subunit ribosomal protein S17
MGEDEQRSNEQETPQGGEPAVEETPGEEAVAAVADEGAGEPPAVDATAAEEPPIEETATETPAAVEAEAQPPEGPGQPTEATSPAGAAQEVRRSRRRLPRALRRQRPKAKREQPSERKPIVRLPKPENERGRRQERRGVVVSSAMDKTIVVKVDTVKAHPRYKKVVRRSRTFHAHDEQNAAKVGDVVRIVETRPLSKLKNWRLAEIVQQAR